MPDTAAHVTISGRVQGVNFRYYTVRKARQLGVNGWVRNLGDGQVEATFEGDESSVREIVDWCQHGPPAAKVSEVVVEWEPPTGSYDSFGVRS
ncbi:MAG TPA: acylphosphatase [Anaerolineales bacterium]|nr:acylphosphatase [Anaerolineales bacterium]